MSGVKLFTPLNPKQNHWKNLRLKRESKRLFFFTRHIFIDCLIDFSSETCLQMIGVKNWVRSCPHPTHRPVRNWSPHGVPIAGDISSAIATPSGRAPTRPMPTRKNHASVCVTCTPLLRRRRKSSQSTASQSQGTTLAKSCPLFEETWNTNRLCTENERKCRIHAQMQARTQ